MEFWPEFHASSWMKEMVAGGLGGMTGVIAGHPFDTLRVRLQQPSNSISSFRLIRTILASEGLSAFYKGMAIPLVSIAFQNALVFQAHGTLSRAFDSHNGKDPPSYKSVALGGVGIGAVQSVLVGPVELLKARLQLRCQQAGPNGPISMAQTIIRREGIKGLYRGLAATILRDAPSYGVYFWTYEYAREWIHPGCRKYYGEESPITMLIAGGLAGVTSWISSYPFDVVKTRLQTQPQLWLDHQSPKYHGIMDCFRKSIREEGPTVLWRGLGTTILRAFVVNGSVFTAYEMTLRCRATDDHGKRTKENQLIGN